VLKVNNNGALSQPFVVLRSAGDSPAFLSLDTLGHVAARHIDSSLVGPAALYPGYTTPAKVGEIISVYGVGFGLPDSGTVVNGAATQSGALRSEGSGFDCWISGIYAQTVGALVSPGLYQFNITIPNGVKSGDNNLSCVYFPNPTFPGALIAVQ
jgi:uncharacterized protein (TIGR03437 family)